MRDSGSKSAACAETSKKYDQYLAELIQVLIAEPHTALRSSRVLDDGRGAGAARGHDRDARAWRAGDERNAVCGNLERRPHGIRAAADGP